MMTTRRVVAETDIDCVACFKAKLVVEEPGSETARWLTCPHCGDYAYIVMGHTLCVGSALYDFELIKKWQGGDEYTALLPWVEERIAAMKRRLGLDRGQ
ncbi:MAG: hypothetical protein Q8R28_15310 [Dehalococcoidia bacterium]|nr:hypothetical protein [Dehalococcoidia bacterium]